MFIFITPISNVITFLVNNSFDQTNSINDILYPTRGWPKKDRNQLNVWQFLYQDAIDKVGKTNDNIVNGFNNFYLAEFDKYRDSASKNAGKPGYDEIGIPTADINDYINNKIIHSQSMQIYMALTLRTYFIEFTINKINDPSSNYINANEYLNLWVMKYFEAGFYFQWVKIWIQDLGRTIEKSIDIDFYTFDKYVERNNKGEYMWNKPPSDNTVKPLLILDSDMKKMFNQLYEEILNNNLQGK
ncbi:MULTISPECIES: hypothetical protein [unclassified Spiroplasma]|uniref:hypothetical protein n=1 Tax=unclassified Spiroplasma TaxID=2637901 RepID=UPI0030D2C273